MARKPLGWSYRDPRRSLNFLDSCAFDPKYSPEHEAAEHMRRLGKEEKIVLHLAHSNQKEIEHPNTPGWVKKEAAEFIFSCETSLTQKELQQKARIHQILTGNGNPENFKMDATHVFEAGRYHGYFVTTDERILRKKAEIGRICVAVIVKPSEWLSIFQVTAIA